MNFTSFFDYGSGTGGDAATDLVFLGNATTADWQQLLTVAERRRFAIGDTLVTEGERTRAFYIVAEGELEVIANWGGGPTRRVSVISKNSIFGEQAFFDSQPRSATVKALQPGELYGISPDAFEVLAGRSPELARVVLLDLGRILSLRLRGLTGMLSQPTR
ncbi:cyclic nucleotide-binding domain-containing protein [Andreprevotia chitinilytica]|uniref:cyclic nucleotide-binding domain-containing protein n=1 Tax=Andreprevotia chitinilytica TaxID=396808 RepID=UPI00068F7EFE|nr:cyclic nucleotide-binding domain-containing protein [Andreprevotia chitinilytica]